MKQKPTKAKMQELLDNLQLSSDYAELMPSQSELAIDNPTKAVKK